MEYIEENLNLIGGEQILAIIRPHPMIYFNEIFSCTVIGGLLILAWQKIIIIAMVVLVLVYALWRSSTYEYGITNKRIIKKHGVLNRRLSIINLEHLEGLSINHGGIIGGLLGAEWGHLTARGMGETIIFEFIPNAQAVREQIIELKQDLH